MPSPYPSVDRLLQHAALAELIEVNGRAMVIAAIRAVLADLRKQKRGAGESEIIEAVDRVICAGKSPRLRRVFNLTGVVLHSNLGRAALSEAAIAQTSMAMRGGTNLEYDLATGARGERDSLVEGLVKELTGAEAAIVVNNNAAAVLLVLAALAENREVVISRGELVEIGGSFRIPDVMKSAHTRLVEVGTTNRTHASDYLRAIGPDTAALMKVHSSNYAVTGFVASVGEAEVAAIAKAHKLPMIVDLGSGSLIDLSTYGLPKEPVVREIVAAGCDVVTFSGDKLLGGPQAGLIVGRKKWIDQIRKHPLKRALRAPKQTYAALEATLLAYRAPDRVVRSIPTLRHLTRAPGEIAAAAARIEPLLAAALGGTWRVSSETCQSRIGSGSLPTETLASTALSIRRQRGKGGNGGKVGNSLQRLAARLRELPLPVIGRISGDALLLDMRCLDDEADFAAQLELLNID